MQSAFIDHYKHIIRLIQGSSDQRIMNRHEMHERKIVRLTYRNHCHYATLTTQCDDMNIL